MANNPPLRDVSAPAELRALRAWLVWRYETYPGENAPRKVPYWAGGGRRFGHQGSERDRASLVDFETARTAAINGNFDGVGFAPMAEFNITALDFDKCVDESGGLPQEVAEIISGTYAELSPSGKGIRAFVRGALGNKKSKAGPGVFGFETFSSSGFVTVTGNALPAIELLDLQDTIAPASAVLADLCRRRFGEERAAPGVVGDDPFAGTERPMGLTIDRMEELLRQLDPDMTREDWIKVGMALHFECDGDDTGFELWNEWSSNGGKYPTEEALRAQWESFSRPRPAGRRPVTMATVLRLVKLASEPQAPAQAANAADLMDLVADTPAGDPRGPMATSTGFTGKYPIISGGALSRRPPGSWLIKGVIPYADVMVLFGASGSGKSFVTLDMAFAIVRGVEWRGHKVKKGRVVVIAAEGGTGVGKRLKAYGQHHGLDVDQLDIGVITAAPNFLQKDEIREIVMAVKDAGGADLIIADTFAQVTAGANENAGEDMGLAMANAKALREATGAMVLLIHHSGKDATRGARGWSGIKAAVDAEIEVTRYDNGEREIRISKMKDGEDGIAWGFKLEIVKVGVDPDGDDITSCVAIDAAVPTPKTDDEDRRSVKRRTKWENHVLESVVLFDKSRSTTRLEELIDYCMKNLHEVPEGERDTRRINIATAIRNLAKEKEAVFILDHGTVMFTQG